MGKNALKSKTGFKQILDLDKWKEEIGQKKAAQEGTGQASPL